MSSKIKPLTFRVRTFPRQRERWQKFYTSQWETSGTATTEMVDLKPSSNLAALDAERKAEREAQQKQHHDKLKAKLTVEQQVEANCNVKTQSKINAMVHYLNAAHIDIRNLSDWRWLGGITGEINGLPTSRGQAMMTDGVLVLIERGDGTVIRAHYNWFVEDSIVGDNPAITKKTRKSKPVDPKLLARAEELFKLLQA